jgi:hypothetical protein
MNKSGIILLLNLLPFIGAAQENALSLGLRTGFGLSHMIYGQNKGKVPYSYRELWQNESFSFGMEAHMPLSSTLGLVTGIQYAERGFGMKNSSGGIARYNYTYLDYQVGVEYQIWQKLHLKTGIEFSNLRQFSTNINPQELSEYRVDPLSHTLSFGIGAMYYVHPSVFVAFQMNAGKLGSSLVQRPLNEPQAMDISQFYINPMFSIGYRYHFKPGRMEEEPITEDASN